MVGLGGGGIHRRCWKGGDGSPRVSWVQTVGKVLAALVGKSQPPPAL